MVQGVREALGVSWMGAGTDSLGGLVIGGAGPCGLRRRRSLSQDAEAVSSHSGLCLRFYLVEMTEKVPDIDIREGGRRVPASH